MGLNCLTLFKARIPTSIMRCLPCQSGGGGVLLSRRNNHARCRVLQGEILSELCRIRFRAGRGHFRGRGCIGLDHWPGGRQSHCPSSGKVPWNIDLLDKAHGRSSPSVACFDGARLERSLESWRREERVRLLFQAYTRGGLRPAPYEKRALLKSGPEAGARRQSVKQAPILRSGNIPSFCYAANAAARQEAPAPESRSISFQASLTPRQPVQSRHS